MEPVKTLPRINEPAPEFAAVTTHGPKKLSDYKGRWLVMFSHPADFTPVCTTEFIGFADRHAEFQARGADLLGVSIDSIFSHLAWVQNIKEKMGKTIPFFIVADLDMKVASAYGMIHPGASDTATVRSVFVIDDKSMIRALVYYPMNVGRNLDEILRLLDGLQTADKHGVPVPRTGALAMRSSSPLPRPLPISKSAWPIPPSIARTGIFRPRS